MFKTKKYKRGYTQGVFDMFHIGHLNLINQAKRYCDYLIVAVNSDELVEQYKHKRPVIAQDERRRIIENIKAVDQAVIAETLDKMAQFEKIGFDVVFIGDDWKGNPRWELTGRELSKVGVDVVFLPYTPDVCSSDLRTVEGHKVTEIKE